MTKEQLLEQVDQHYYSLLTEVQKFVLISAENDATFLGENSNMFYIYRNGDSYKLKKVIN